MNHTTTAAEIVEAVAVCVWLLLPLALVVWDELKSGRPAPRKSRRLRFSVFAN